MPFRRFGHPHHRQSLLQYIFPRAVRDRYRQKLLNFNFDTFPHYKHRFQSRIYRFLVERERKRRDGSRLVDLVSRHTGRLLLGPKHSAPSRRRRAGKDVNALGEHKKMSQWDSGYGNGPGAYGGDAGGDEGVLPYERGTRRRKLAAMAGSIYRAGAAAASEVRDQYNNTRIRGLDTSDNTITIPGSFPDVAITVRGDDQMVLFPSYAKRHVKQFNREDSNVEAPAHTSTNGEEYWNSEWARLEDEKAIVDVDVRGWVYTPHKGALTRKNRLLIGMARRLSGIPPPTMQSNEQAFKTSHEEHEEMREQRRIAKEAEQIEKRGQGEKEVATRGGYSEQPKEDDSEAEDASVYNYGRIKSGTVTPGSAPGSPVLAGRTAWNTAADLTEAELAVANANLMARLGPFLTNPFVQQPVTFFFYNDENSQSRTATTNDAGHFQIRAALDFVPTHVRVLANEDLSAIEPVQIIESQGVSVISDIDDTIKRSNISLGAREIFRNTFIRDLAGMSVDGITEWYTSLSDMGVQFHYCSNSPWQLFPVLATFFKGANLPPGSLHLKQYSGMLQGIFEPVAERKKGTLDRIMRDFPERKFLLVGDSGEADLEVYTDLAQANPGRILAIFIRDVTTPERAGFFDSAIDPSIMRRKAPAVSSVIDYDPSDGVAHRPTLPPRIQSEPPKPEGPVMGTLIDFADEPEQMSPGESQKLDKMKSNDKPTPGNSALDLLGRKPPPPRPTKPAALRGSPSELASSSNGNGKAAPPPPHPRRKQTGQSSGHNPLTKVSSNHRLGGSTSLDIPLPSTGMHKSASSASLAGRPQPALPPRRGTPTGSLNLSPRLIAKRRTTANSDVDFEALPPSLNSPTESVYNNVNAAVNKKVDLWRRRLARAQETLDHQGVQLYTWRRGEDVVLEAVGIVREALREIEKGKQGGRRR